MTIEQIAESVFSALSGGQTASIASVRILPDEPGTIGIEANDGTLFLLLVEEV